MVEKLVTYVELSNNASSFDFFNSAGQRTVFTQNNSPCLQQKRFSASWRNYNMERPRGGGGDCVKTLSTLHRAERLYTARFATGAI